MTGYTCIFGKAIKKKYNNSLPLDEIWLIKYSIHMNMMKNYLFADIILHLF